MDFTSNELITKLKKRGMIPTSQETFQNDDFLRFLNDELIFKIVPFVMSLREEFFVTYEDTIIGSNTSFDIPSRAVGVKLRDIEIVDSGGDITPLTRIEPENKDEYNDAYNSNLGFYMRNDQIVLVGTFNANDYVRQHYFRRPNDLVLQASCALVSSVSGNDITCSSMPTTWLVTDTFDVIKGTRHFKSRGDAKSITAIDTSAKTLSFSSAPTGIVAGDWICKAGESCIAQVPFDVFPLLVYRAAAEVCRANGDHEAAKVKDEAINAIEQSLVSMLSDRVEGKNRKLKNRENFATRNAIVGLS